MKCLAILLALPLLGGCDVQSREGNTDAANLSIHSGEGGRVSFDVGIAQGQVNVPGMKIGGDDFDIDGVRLMPGSSVTGFNIDAANKGATVNVSFTSPAPPDQTRAYFVDKFKAQGVRAAISGDRVAGTTKDGDPFNIEVGTAPGGSQGKITVRSNN